MCQFKYTRHSCGHILPKLEVNQDPSCKLCVPVLVGLKYYHDQPLHECIENAFRQAPLRIPRPCRPVGPNTPFDSEELIHACGRDWRQFEETMHRLGVTLEERNSVEALALRHNQTSNRDTNVPLRPVGHNVLRYMMELEKWQHRQFQPPNIIFDTVSWGCGGTGPGVQGHCLVGWTGQGILMYRHGIWNVNPPHSFGTWSPQPVGYLYINYGEAPILQLPKDGDWRAKATRTLIDIPMYSCLYAVLSGRPSGPLIENDEGYLVPALGASGPEIIRPHLPPLPPPTSSVLPLPQLAMSSMHKGQPRPRQAFVPAARSRRGPGHRYSATWNSPTSFNEAEGRPKPNESQKQMTYKGGYSQSKTKAGPNQSVDRAKINTKIKQLPQQRVSRSRTPATTASTGIPQPMSSTHPTPGSTRPATSTGNVAQSDEPTIGLGIIDESSPAAPLEDTVGNAEGKSSRIYHITIYLANDSQTLFFTNLLAIPSHNPTKHKPTKQEPRHLCLKERSQ